MAVPILRPRSTPEIVDAAFQLARRHFMPLLLVSAIVAIPSLIIGAINAWLLPAPDPEQPFGREWLMTLPLSFLGMCWTFISYGAVTIAAADAYLGGTTDPGASLRRAIARATPLIAGNLIGYFIMLLPFLAAGALAPIMLPGVGEGATAPEGSFLLVGLLFLALAVFGIVWLIVNIARVTLVTPIAALERGGALATWRRATQLAEGSKKRILLLVLIAGAVIFGIVFGGFALIRTVVGNESLAAALSGVVAIPLWPVLGSLFVVLYYDLRIRKEAFDLEVMTGSLDAPLRQSSA